MRSNLPVTQREYPFPATDAIVSTTNLRGMITYCNETFVEVSGFTRDELIGQPQNILRHPDMPCEAFRDMWSTIRSGQPWSAVVKNRRKNGDHYWVRANVTPIVAGGEAVGYLSVRTCPSREEVAASAKLYAQMRKIEEAGGRLAIGLHRGTLVHRNPVAALYRQIIQSSAARMGVVVAIAVLLPMLFRWLSPSFAHHWLVDFGLAALAIFVGTVLLRSMLVRPMAAFTDQSNTMAAGDLAQTPSIGGGGVSAGLARALNQLNVNLRAVVGDVRKEIVNVGSAADSVARGASDLAQRTETQAASLEQAAAAMEQFASVLQQSGQRGVEARGLADAMATAAGEGKTAIDAVGDTMQLIERAAHDIGEVTALVDELAFQTNLLALNAAVEAARAGEHGRGFAVVAGEVRVLAQRSTAASKNIRELVSSSLTQVDQGVVAVRGANERMHSIVQAASRVRLLIEEIAAAAAEQTAGVNQINDMISQLDGVTQRNAAMVGEATAAANGLRHQATQLAQSVAIFQLEQPAPTSA